jgi:hypothetical protein
MVQQIHVNSEGLARLGPCGKNRVTFCQRSRHRFLQQNVLAFPQSSGRVLAMQMIRRGDDESVDRRTKGVFEVLRGMLRARFFSGRPRFL